MDLALADAGLAQTLPFLWIKPVAPARRDGRIVRVAGYHGGTGERPVPKQSLAIDIFLGHEAPNPRVAGIVAIVAHYEIVSRFYISRGLAGVGHVQLRIEISFVEVSAIYAHSAVMHLDHV